MLHAAVAVKILEHSAIWNEEQGYTGYILSPWVQLEKKQEGATLL